MKRAKIIATACFTVLIGVMVLMNAHAQDATGFEKSILTFSAPVELPGLTLQAGTYVFKRPDSNTARVIQVFTENQKEVLGMFLTVPTTRLEVTDENVVTFKENREGLTPAVHYWYYPGRQTGHEFVYPKEQAMRIAARTGERVLSTEGDISEQSTVTPIEGGVMDDAGPSAEASAAEASATPAEPAPETQVASNVDMSKQGPEASQSSEMPRETVGTSGQGEAGAAAGELPKTASPLALSALIGLLSLGGAASLRRVRK